MACSMEEDGLMEDAILYLQKKTYHVGLSKNEKRVIRRKAEKFSLETGGLLYTKKDKTKVASYLKVQKIRSTVNGTQNNRISS